MKSGIIEGFYGIPWTFEDRLSMIEFLSGIKMTEYIYAPKDDLYHNFKWREAYPKDELDKLRKLSDFSKEKNINFIWAIHPGQNTFDFDNYDEEFSLLLKKYKSLRDIGIENFAICMDDINRKKAYEDRLYHKKLIEDIIKNLDLKGDLIYVNPWYNSSWIDDYGKEYYKTMSEIKGLSMMWTGYDVVVPLRHKANEDFKKLTGYDPLIWFNWPVNDYKRSEIFIEKFEFYDSFDNNFEAIYINPMNQAEASKISIYQIKDFLKKGKDYDKNQAFTEAIKNIEKRSYKEIEVLADSFYSSGVYEREENQKDEREKQIYNAFIKKDYKKMICAVDKKIKAIDSYEKNHENEILYKELHPFFKSLSFLLKTVKAIVDKDLDKAKDYFLKANSVKIKILKEYSNDEVINRDVYVSERLREIIEKLKDEI